jgi:hypothetical protein
VKGSKETAKGMRALVIDACVHRRDVARLNTNDCTAASETMDNFTPSKNQAEVCNQELLNAIDTGGVSFAPVENSHLVTAAKAVTKIIVRWNAGRIIQRHSIAEMDSPLVHPTDGETSTHSRVTV